MKRILSAILTLLMAFGAWPYLAPDAGGASAFETLTADELSVTMESDGSKAAGDESLAEDIKIEDLEADEVIYVDMPGAPSGRPSAVIKAQGADYESLSVTVTEADTLKSAVDAELVRLGSPDPQADYGDIANLAVTGPLSARGSTDDRTFTNDWTFIRMALTSLASLDLSNITNAEIPSSTRIIANAKLKTIVLGRATKSIASSVFRMSRIESINLDGVTSIGQNAFQNCASLSDIGRFGGQLTIDQSAFSGCTKLSELDFSGVEISIAASAFSYCTALEKIDFGDMWSVPDRAFYGCTSLREIDVREIRSFGVSAFDGCTNLEDVKFPPHAIYDASSFANCALLFTKGFPGGVYKAQNSFAGQKPKAYLSLSPSESFAEQDEPVRAPTVNIRDRDGDDYGNLFYAGEDYSSWLSPSARMPVVTTTPEQVDFSALSGTTGDKTIGYEISGAPGGVTSAVFTLHVRAPDPDALRASPVASGITYGALLGTSEIAGVVTTNLGAVVAGVWTWNEPGLKPVAGATPCNATFTPNDNARYQPFRKTVNVPVAKANPIVSVPTVSAIEEGQPLSDMTFGRFSQSGIPGDKLNGAWSFVYPEDLFFEGTHHKVPVEYDPKNPNYNSVRGVVSITILETTAISPHHVVVTVTKAGDLKDAVDKTLTSIGFSPQASYGDILSLTVKGPLSTTPSNNLTTLTNDWTFIRAKLTRLSRLDLSGVTSNTIPGQNYNYAPLGGARLREVILSPAIKTIGDYAAYNNAGLRSINLGDVTSVNQSAFSGCVSLQEADLRSVTRLGTYAFSYCNDVKEVDLSALNTASQFGSNAFRSCRSLEQVTLGDYLSAIPEFAFLECSALKEIEMKNVLTIESRAFSGCSSLVDVGGLNRGRINRITFGSYSFAGCASLKTIDLSKHFVLSGSYAFRDCTSLDTIISLNSGETNKWIETLPAGFFRNTNIRRIDLSNFTSLGEESFAYCGKLDTIVGLNSGLTNDRIKVIPTSCFMQCASLRTIDISHVNSLGDNAFYSCTSLKSVDFSSMQSLGASAFYRCTALTDIVGLNRGRTNTDITRIPNSCFSGCVSIETIDLSHVVNIDHRAFLDLAKLQYVDLRSVVALGDGSFSGCGLRTIEGFNTGETNMSIKRIPFECFMNNRSLRSMDLSYVTRVDQTAFKDCINLEDVTFPRTSTSYGIYAFSGCALVFTGGLPPGHDTPGNQGSASTAFANQKPKAYLSFGPGSSSEIYARFKEDVDPPTVLVMDHNGNNYNDLIAHRAEYSAWLSPEAKRAVVTTSPASVDFKTLTSTVGTKTISYDLSGPPADRTRLDFIMHVWSALFVKDGPDAQPITYGQTVGASDIAGAVADEDGNVVKGRWAWDEPKVSPDAGRLSFAAKFVPNEDDKYDALTDKIGLTVRKAKPDVTVPVAHSIVSGQTIGDARLGAFTQKGVLGETLKGEWSFLLPPETVLPEGTHDVEIEYDPNDSNYNKARSTVKLRVTPENVIEETGDGSGSGGGIGSGSGDGVGSGTGSGAGSGAGNSAGSGVDVVSGGTTGGEGATGGEVPVMNAKTEEKEKRSGVKVRSILLGGVPESASLDISDATPESGGGGGGSDGDRVTEVELVDEIAPPLIAAPSVANPWALFLIIIVLCCAFVTGVIRGIRREGFSATERRVGT